MLAVHANPDPNPDPNSNPNPNPNPNTNPTLTTSKAMLAVHAAELTTIAESNNAKIGWEAAVGGGIPCIRALREGCAANRISYAAGILNGARHTLR